MSNSVHDNFIISYEVLCEEREIRMRTEYRDRGEPFERTLVVFSGVEAYDFRNDCLGNIVFGIDELSAESILAERAEEFSKTSCYGWPPFWRDPIDEVRSYLRARDVRGFELSSSFGMTGWVLAREMKMIPD